MILNSHNAFINPVFARTDDTFYLDDLRRLDFRKYLWFLLHEKGYRYVYFIEEDSSAHLTAQNFGEAEAVEFSEGGFIERLSKRISKTEDTAFIGWLGEILRGSNSSDKSAVVFPIELFCKLGGRVDNIAKLLSPEKSTGSIVLVVPPYPEYVSLLTQKQSMFDVMGESYLTKARDEKNADYLGFLETKSKNDGAWCMFLHTYTKKRMTSLLSHVMFDRFDERFVPDDTLSKMGEYLAYYLNNRFMQLEERFEERLFGSDFDLRMPMYRELYNRLMKSSVWNALLARVELISKRNLSVEEYVRETGKRYFVAPCDKIPVVGEANSIEYRLMGLEPTDTDCDTETASSVDGTAHRRHLDTLWRNSRLIGNREPDKTIHKKTGEYLDKLDKYVTRDDKLTCRCIVYALSLLSELSSRLFEEDISEEKKGDMIKILDCYISCAENLHIKSENYKRSINNGGVGGSMASLSANTAALEYKACANEFENIENALPLIRSEIICGNADDNDRPSADALEIMKRYTTKTAEVEKSEVKVIRSTNPFKPPKIVK